MGIWSLLGIIIAGVVSIWGTMKYLVSQHYRLDDTLSKGVLDKIINKSTFRFEIISNLSVNNNIPRIYQSFVKIDGLYLFFNLSERMLTAGWQSKEIITEIYFLRWQNKKVKNFIMNSYSKSNKIDVMCLQPHGTVKLGELSSEINEIILDKKLYSDIEQDIKYMLDNNRDKTGCLLYGKPGNGKTKLVKYFSQKFNLPIYTVSFNPDHTNLEILTMFESVPDKCIVLIEDFDSYFDNKKCIMANTTIRFTFDSILNSLDGVYNEYKQVVFIMTVNNIDKVDVSIKHRPSRFKFVREITPPNYNQRLEMLGTDSLAKQTDGMSIDKVLFVQSIKDKYSDDEIMEKANSNI